MLKRIIKAVLKFLAGFVLGIFIVVGWIFYQDVQLDKSIGETYLLDTHYQYHYSKLSEEEKLQYQRIYYAFSNFEEDIDIEADSIEQVEKIYYSVLDDHPEFYYIDLNFEYYDGYDFTVYPKFNYTSLEVEEYNKQIDNLTKEIINKTSQENDEVKQMQLLYDYIIENTEYKENKNDQNILSVFIDNESICAGYARAYQYLLSKIDINATYMGGVSLPDENQESEGHAWVMVNVDDDYYYCDPTWGDSVNNKEHTCYGYFLMDSDEMLNHYTPDGYYEETINDYLNYYDSIGCYMKEYDEDILSYAVKLGLENKTRVAEVKCANLQIFKKLKNEIENNYLGYYILKENNCYSGKASYLCDEKTLVIELYY